MKNYNFLSSYKPGDLVHYNGKGYEATAISSGKLPFNKQYWKEVSSNVTTLNSTKGDTETSIPRFDKKSLYKTGDVVSHEGVIYKAKTGNQVTPYVGSAFWEVQHDDVPIRLPDVTPDRPIVLPKGEDDRPIVLLKDKDDVPIILTNDSPDLPIIIKNKSYGKPNPSIIIIDQKGHDGAIGEVGPKGDKGDKGEQGRQGNTGFPGVDGKEGPAGKDGAKGEVGPKGDKGDKGDSGEKGDQGPVGKDGAKGDKGDRGEQGPPGEVIHTGGGGSANKHRIYSAGSGMSLIKESLPSRSSLKSFNGGSGINLTDDGDGNITIAATGGGTVTSLSIVSANGFSGTVANATTTPAVTLGTSITGLLKGNGTALSAATAGTDYSVGTASLSTGILKSTTSTGALSIAVAADFPTLNQNTTGNAATVTTNANMTGDVTSVGNATTLASTQSGTHNWTAAQQLSGGALLGTATSLRSTSADSISPAASLVGCTGTVVSDYVGRWTGTGTKFLSEIQVGDIIVPTYSPTVRDIITGVYSDTSMSTLKYQFNSYYGSASTAFSVIKRPIGFTDSTGKSQMAISDNQIGYGINYGGAVFWADGTLLQNARTDYGANGVTFTTLAADGRMYQHHNWTAPSQSSIEWWGGNAPSTLIGFNLSSCFLNAPLALGSGGSGGGENSIYVDRTGTYSNKIMYSYTRSYANNGANIKWQLAAAGMDFGVRLGTTWNDPPFDYLTMCIGSANGRIQLGNFSSTPSEGPSRLNFLNVGETHSVKTGTNATIGTVILSGGTATVSTTAITSNSMIILSAPRGTVTNLGAAYESARIAGTSFTLTSVNILDTATYDWYLVEKN